LVAAAVIAFAAVRAVLAARSRLAAPSCNER